MATVVMILGNIVVWGITFGMIALAWFGYKNSKNI